MDLSKPAFLQGHFSYEGQGLERYQDLLGARYRVPYDRRGQLIYFRAGNPAPELVAVALLRDGKIVRHFPIGAKASVHVPLAVVEDLAPEAEISLAVAAPAGLASSVIVDIGFVEI